MNEEQKQLEFMYKCEETLDKMMDLLFTGKNLNYMEIVEAEDTILRLKEEFYQMLINLQEKTMMKVKQMEEQDKEKNYEDKSFIVLSALSSITTLLGLTLDPKFFLTTLACVIGASKIIHTEAEEIEKIDFSDFLLDNCDKLNEIELRLDNYYEVLQAKEYKFYVDMDKAYTGNNEELSEKDIYLIANVLNMLLITKQINEVTPDYKKEITDRMYKDLSTFLGEDNLSYDELVNIFRDIYKEYFNGTSEKNIKTLTKKIENL